MRSVGALLVLAGALTTTGCSGSGFPGPAPCLPARMHADPAAAVAGGVATVSAGPADCELGYEPGHRYTIRILAVGVGVGSPPITTAVDGDGRFSADVPIPTDFPHGPAAVVVTGSPYDECGKNGYGSCAGYTVSIEVR